MKRFVIAASAFAILAAAQMQARADAKCEPATLSTALDQRMQAEGKTKDEITDILGSGFKRRILSGRVADASGCPDTAIKVSLDLLADKYK